MAFPPFQKLGPTTLTALFLAAQAGTAAAQDGGTYLGPSQGGASMEACVDVEIGGERTSSLSCLNSTLQQQAERARPTATIPPVDSGATAVKVGGFSATALANQFGSRGYETSVIPPRPPRIYVSPIGNGN